MLIDQRGIGQGPEVFGGLQFRRIGWQEQQMDMVRHTQALGAVPTCSIEHEHNLLLCSSPCLTRECLQLRLEEGDVDTRRQMEERAA